MKVPSPLIPSRSNTAAIHSSSSSAFPKFLHTPHPKKTPSPPPTPPHLNDLLSTASHTKNARHFARIHARIITSSSTSLPSLFLNRLLSLYAKYGQADQSLLLLSWNEHFDRAVLVFRKVLKRDAIVSDEVIVLSALSACAKNGSSEFGKQAGGARNVVTWTAMMTGFVRNGKFEEACHYFSPMRSEGVDPSKVSYSVVLHAASSISALSQGTSIHSQILKSGCVNDSYIGSALIMMYAKCGSLADAARVFEEIGDQTEVCWSAMITAFQEHGRADHEIELFEDMLGEGTKPDYITLVSLLSACSHAGRVDEGYSYFNSMSENFGINPRHEHYACMVDLLGRAGRLDEAKKFIESMPIKADITAWGALLGACSNHGNLEMGREVADKLFELQPDNPGNYVLLSNMYSREGRLKEADEVRRLMSVNGLKKDVGCSWVNIKNTTSVFTARDRSHAMTCEIHEMLGRLEELVKKKGYVPQVQFPVDSLGDYRERNLWYHSERLALAFALLLPNRASVRIMKNLRTCGDCHTLMKFASDIYRREIVVRDFNRFHRFTDGRFSCGDYLI